MPKDIQETFRTTVESVTLAVRLLIKDGVSPDEAAKTAVSLIEAIGYWKDEEHYSLRELKAEVTELKDRL